jgi:hypothetical protein
LAPPTNIKSISFPNISIPFFDGQETGGDLSVTATLFDNGTWTGTPAVVNMPSHDFFVTKSDPQTTLTPIKVTGQAYNGTPSAPLSSITSDTLTNKNGIGDTYLSLSLTDHLGLIASQNVDNVTIPITITYDTGADPSTHAESFITSATPGVSDTFGHVTISAAKTSGALERTFTNPPPKFLYATDSLLEGAGAAGDTNSPFTYVSNHYLPSAIDSTGNKPKLGVEILNVLDRGRTFAETFSIFVGGTDGSIVDIIDTKTTGTLTALNTATSKAVSSTSLFDSTTPPTFAPITVQRPIVGQVAPNPAPILGVFTVTNSAGQNGKTSFTMQPGLLSYAVESSSSGFVSVDANGLVSGIGSSSSTSTATIDVWFQLTPNETYATAKAAGRGGTVTVTVLPNLGNIGGGVG